MPLWLPTQTIITLEVLYCEGTLPSPFNFTNRIFYRKESPTVGAKGSAPISPLSLLLLIKNYLDLFFRHRRLNPNYRLPLGRYCPLVGLDDDLLPWFSLPRPPPRPFVVNWKQSWITWFCGKICLQKPARGSFFTFLMSAQKKHLVFMNKVGCSLWVHLHSPM